MSSHTDHRRQRRSSKAIDQSTDWSQWNYDQGTGRYFRTRNNEDGVYMYEWDTQAASNISQDTPKIDPELATLSPYAGSTTSSDYGSEYAFQHNAQPATNSVDSVTEKLASTALYTPRQDVVRSTSYGEYQSTSQAQAGDSAPQPISIRSPLAPADPFGYQLYSMSAPPGGNMGSYQAGMVAMASGYNTMAVSGGFTTSQSSQMYSQVPTASPKTHSATGSGWDVRSTSMTPEGAANPVSTTQQGGEASGSGAITPTAPNVIKGAAGAKKGDHERLDSRFRVHSSKDFKMFQSRRKVFKVLWSQPMGETAGSSATDVTEFTLGKTKYGEKVYSSIRRFVVVTEDHGHCLCLAISTYQRQGTGKSGIKRDDHAIIYTKDRPPKLLPGETALNKDAIEVIAKTPRDTLEVGSRINYAKIYTVEHNVKVHFVGHIAPKSRSRFIRDYDATSDSKRYKSYIAEEADD